MHVCLSIVESVGARSATPGANRGGTEVFRPDVIRPVGRNKIVLREVKRNRKLFGASPPARNSNSVPASARPRSRTSLCVRCSPRPDRGRSSEAEVSRFRMREIEPAHARARPHRERFGDQHSRVLLHIEQIPEWTLFCVVRTRRISRRRPDPAILF